MSLPNKVKSAFLVMGDIAALYAALFAALVIRSRSDVYLEFTERHFLPFTIIFGGWILLFYIAGLYDLRKLHNNIEFFKTLGLVIVIGFVLSVFVFYLVPFFGISPKTNLFLFAFCFAIIEVVWRRLFNQIASSKEADTRLILVGDSPIAGQIYEEIKRAPQLGYEVKQWLKDESAADIRTLRGFIEESGINLIAVPSRLKNNNISAKYLYELLCLGVEISDLPTLFEAIFRKVPLSEVDEGWLLEHVGNHHKFYDSLKRAGEFLTALILGIILLPIFILIALAIKIISPGPVIYKQVRVGKNNKEFTLYKFRTMQVNAEKAGPQWAEADDARIVPGGKFLRYTHLDELPQLWNILRGEMSFVGPRPERPEFVRMLKEKIPYYEIRHVVKPGIAGWAQLNYRYGASVEDAHEKLQYEIYYLQNRSVVLDLAIIVKTLRAFFVNQQ